VFDSDIFGPIARFLEMVAELKLRCVVGGSVASSLQGLPRQTIDLDVVVELEEVDIPRLVEAARRHFYVSDAAVLEAVRHRRGFNLIHGGTSFKIDVYVSGDTEFDRQQFARAVDARLPGLEGHVLRLASAEDVILRKLEWCRLGNEVSDRQWYDVMGVMKVQSSRLDDAYLDRWADQRGLSELLARARRESTE